MKVQSQNYYDTYKSFDFTKSYNSLKKSTDSIITIAKKNKFYSDVAKISKEFSLKAYRNNYDEAIYYAKMSYENKELIKEIDKDYVGAIYRVAYFYFKKKNINKAIKYFEKCIEINASELVSGQALCELGRCYFELNDYYKSINYYKKGISILEELNKYEILEREYKNISLVYDELDTKNSLLSKLEILKRADSIEKKHRNSPTQRLKISNAYVTLFSREKMYNFNKAVYLSKQNIALATRHSEPEFLCTSYVNLTNLYNIEKNDSALYYAKEALKYCKRPIAKSSYYYTLSDYYNQKKNLSSALTNIQKSLNIYLDSTDQLTYNNVPKLSDLNNLDERDYIIKVINDKSKLLNKLSKQENNIKHTELALKHILVADSLVDIIQAEITNTTKLHWRLKATEIYTQGAKLCYDLNDPKTAFYLLEKGKALLLTENIKNNNALSKLPDSVKAKELKLKKNVVDYSHKTTENIIKDQQFQAELNYEAYIDSIKTIYPQHFKNQSLQNIISLKSLKETLDKNTVIISYLWPNSDIDNNITYALFISNDITELLKIGDSKNISNLIDSYRKSLSRPFTTDEDKKEFNKVAHQLYKTLLQIETSRISINDKNLIIVPDGKLHNIPFEAFTTSENSLDYLIKKNTISYAYSMSFLEHNKAIQRNTPYNFVGYAPTKFDTLNLPSLEHSISEINNIDSSINGTIFTNESASKASFLNNANNSKIIHLATHADASDSPWIAFSDKKMSLQELYTFKNNAELAVLSSCNTSIGKIATGEGVMSLARGFFYSGSNSVIASLWNVNDKSTSFLMDSFYKNLKKGKTKSDALRQAKLNYIESHSLSETSPYYWSSFILIGDTSMIDLENDYTILSYFILGFILLIITLLFFRNKNK